MSVKDEILEYMSQFQKKNKCFPKLFFSKGEISEKEQSDKIIDSIFGNCGKKKGIEVWITNKESKNLIYLKKKPISIQSLSNKNNYIFLKTYQKLLNHKGALILKPTFYHEIYYWIGDINNIKNNFSVCYYTSLLSYKMQPQNTFREEYQNETQKFQNIFKDKLKN